MRCDLIDASERTALLQAQDILALHALAATHNSSIDFGGGNTERLYAGFGNTDRWLEVKVDIVFSDFGKPLMTPICLFLTKLLPEDHCAPSLLSSEPVLFDFWRDPIEIGPDGCLVPIG